jgi:hypothetical protein
MRRWCLVGVFICSMLASALSALAQQPVNIILDSDMASDADDTGDHAMLWALVKNGQANVLALTISSTNDYSAPTAWAIANYYGHPNVLIGAYQGNIPGDYHNSNSYYTQQVASTFGKPGDTRANYPDAVTVYREALAAAPNGSVYIICGGFYEPLKALLQSPADSISPLTGQQLVAQKVKALIPATGYYPNSGSSGDGNLAADPGGASYVAANWPTPVVWVDDAIGSNLLTGPAATASESTNPVKLAYDLQCGEGQWCPNQLPGWTQVAILYAVNGLGNNLVFGGTNGLNTVNSTTGANSWKATSNGQQSYIESNTSPATLNNIINPLIQAPATGSDQPPVVNSQSLSSSGNTLSITLTGTDPNGLPLTYSIVSNPTHGTLTGTPPNVQYTPSLFDGTDSFTFKASDGILTSNIGTVSIAVKWPPTALSQVLTNTGSAIAITLSATDLDANPLVYTIVSNPTHGTLSGTPPSVTYTPTAGYTGTDSFTFQAYDGSLASNIATVTITNDKPPVANPQSLSSSGNPVSITLTGTDPNGLSLTYSIVSSPSHGSLSGTPPNVQYTPGAFDGTDSFTFQANDGILSSNVATVSIAVNYPAPVANAQSVNASTGNPVSITLTGSDSDKNPLTYAIVTEPAHGVITGVPPSVTYTSTTGYSGSDSFSFQVNDGLSNSTAATVSITISAVPPVNIIFDSNLGVDADSLGDHAMLWDLANSGAVNVLAILTSSINDYSAPTAWAIANYYGHPNAVIGAYQGNIPNAYHYSNSYYTQQITQQFGKPNDTRANYPNSVTVYRQTLANAANGSVVLVVGGYYQSLEALLQSPADSISPLTGMQLVTQKIKFFVWCAGVFPNSGSDGLGDLAGDPDGASYVAANWPSSVPIYWMDKQIANNELTGPAASATDSTNPIKLGYDLVCGDGQWCPDALPPWTQVGILYAVYGLQDNFYIAGSNGTVTVWNSSQSIPGWDEWNPTPNNQQNYLELLTTPTAIQNIINPLIQAAP